jgi:hypothetical protein
VNDEEPDCSSLSNLLPARNVELTHDDGCPTRSFVRLPLVLISRIDDRDDEMAEAHAQGANGKSRLASHVINVKNCWNCGNQHHNADNTGREQGRCIRAEAELGKDLS